MKRSTLLVAALLVIFSLVWAGTSHQVQAQIPNVIYLPIIIKTDSLTPPPSDPVCEGGSCKFYVVPAEAAQITAPVVFKVATANFTQIPPQASAPNGGYQVTGNLTLETLLGDIPLAQADFIIERGSSPLAGLERVHGRAELPFPSLGFVNLGAAQATTMAEIGLDRGKNLTRFDAPLLPERQYLFFHTEQGIEVSLNPVPGEPSVALTYELSSGTTFLLDPLDPSFYFDSVEIPGVGAYALGRSVNGLIPYQPSQTSGVESEMISFNGHQYDRLKDVAVPYLPLTMDGSAVVNYGPLNLETPCLNCLFEPSPMFNPAGGIFDEIATADQQLGLNGELAFALPLPGNFNVTVWGDQQLDFSLGQASAMASYHPTTNQVSVAFSGMLEPTTLIPNILVVQPNAQITTYGVIDVALDTGKVEDFYVILKGDLSLAGVDLGANSQVRIDKKGASAMTSVEFPASIPETTITGKRVKYTPLGIDVCVLTGEIKTCTINNPFPVPDVSGIKHADWDNICIPLSIGGLPSCTITIPGTNGDVTGTIALTIDSTELSGTFSGQYCPISGICESITGQVVFNPPMPPKVCVDDLGCTEL